MFATVFSVIGALGIGISVFFVLAFRFSSERLGFIVGASFWVLAITLQFHFPEPVRLWTIVYSTCWTSNIVGICAYALAYRIADRD